MQFDYRNFRLEDYDEVSHLVMSLTKSEMWPCHLPNNDYHCLVAISKDRITNHKVWNYEVIKPGQIIGFASMFLLRKIFWPQPVAQIEDVIVDENARNNYVGKTLVRELIIRAKRLNCYKVVLNCSEDNKEFYEKLGFKLAECQMRLDL